MIWLSAGALAFGFIGVIWLVAVGSVDERFGSPAARSGVAGCTAFGIGGLSAAFGGWPTPLVVVGAIVAAAAAATYAGTIGVD